MNKVYRLIWSAVRQCWIVAAEKVTAKGGIPARTVGALSVAVLLACGSAAYALPTDGTVAAGSASISSPSAGQMQINQTSNRAVINWQSFGIAKGEAVNITQPSAQAALLNRVIGNSSSEIYGSLTANGQVFLINPNGVLFGKGASVNVGGLVASSLNITDDNFMNNNLKFFKDGTAGSVVNQGSITAGFAALLGPTVENSGSIVTYKGSTALGAANVVTLDFDTSGLIALTLTEGAYNAQVSNSGIIEADAGRVILTAKSADGILKSMVNTSGIIRARSVDTSNGQILLLGDMDNGTVKVGGTLDASGGFIETSAHDVSLQAGATVKAKNWLIDPTDITIDATEAAVLVTSLNAGTDITETTSSGGSDAGNITVASAVTWTGIGTLTLDADHNISINAAITGTNGGLTLSAGNSISAPATVNVGTFDLQSGSWRQIGSSLPSFSATDFRISGGSFIRALSGNGSSSSPYALTDIYGVQGIGSSGMLANHYTLANDIDASGTANWNSGSGFKPIGDSSTNYTGTFDGLNHVIDGLTINRDSEYIGLFGYAGSGSSFSNLGLTNLNVAGYNYTGGLAGYSYATLSNVYASGTVTGSNAHSSWYVGGLLGYNNGGSIDNSHFTGSVTASGGFNYWYFGGLAGYSTGAISNSYADVTLSADSTDNLSVHYFGGLAGYQLGSISDSHTSITMNNFTTSKTDVGGEYLGGLAGYMKNGAISNSYVEGNIQLFHTHTNDGGNFIGGLVGGGYNISSISDSHFSGNLLGAQTIGGLIGYNFLNSATVSISNSYSTGAITGRLGYVGGLIGEQSGSGSISNSYSTATISSGYYTGGLVGKGNGLSISDSHYIGTLSGGGSHVGGLAGYLTGSISNSYAEGAVTGGSYTGGLVGQTSGTVSNSYHIGDVTSTGSDYVGGLIGYTTGAVSNSYATGDVTASSADYVGGLIGYASANVSNSYATGDVIGYEQYIGGLVGMFKGTDISISDSHATGNVSSSITVDSASASSSYVGGLVGQLYGDNTDITNSYATGNVTGGSGVGGLLGGTYWELWFDSLYQRHIISNSYATGNVTATASHCPGCSAYGNGDAGGLVGWSDNLTITNSYATGNVSGYRYVGGLIGYGQGFYYDWVNDIELIYGKIVNSYATGTVSASYSSGNAGGLMGRAWGGVSISNSFWNTQTTGQSNAASGDYTLSNVTGLTTAQMKSASNFSSAGWDISTTGGSSAIWRIYEGYTYPLLRSFLTALTVTPVYDGSGTALTNIAALTGTGSYDSSKVLGSATSSTLTLSSSSAGSYTASANAGSSGLYSTQQGYDISYADRTITTTGSAAGDIVITNPITWSSGTLAINTSGSISATAAISGTGSSVFNLQSGTWSQVGSSLPAFSVYDFRLSGGSFIRTLSGDGSSSSPYALADIYGVQGIGSSGMRSKYYLLANDIDATGTAHWNSGAGFKPIGDSSHTFTGSFDGQSHTIDGLFINRASEMLVGLFGINYGAISNLTLTNADVTGSFCVGALVGCNMEGGSISNVSVQGSVVATDESAGLVAGGNSDGGTISNATASGSVSGVSNVGGLVGVNWGVLSNASASVTVSGTYDEVGGLVGENGGSISNSYATGDVSGDQYVGGLVGHNVIGTASDAGQITDVYASGTVSGVNSVGGLIGTSDANTVISNAYATGSVTGTEGVAGLVGLNDGGSISASYATGSVTGGSGSTSVGGLVGENWGSIATSYATGNVSGDSLVGGLTGYNFHGDISNSYATGSVTGTGDYVGGLAGGNDYSTISNSYATGAVTGGNIATTGGLVGNNNSNSTISNSFFNTDTSGQSSAAGDNAGTLTNVVGKTTSELQTASTFSDAGWDISTTGGSTAVWRIYDGYTTPLLRSFLTSLTVSMDGVSKTYDGTTDVSAAASYSTSYDASKVLGTLAAATSSKNVGSYSVSASGLYSTQQGYDISYQNGMVTIIAKTLTASDTTAGDKVYDGTTAATVSGGTLSGVVSGDTVTLAQSGAFADKNVGTGKIVSIANTLSGDDAGNYTIADGSTTADITAKTITVSGTTTASDKVYDGTTAATVSGGTISGVISGDTVVFSQSGTFADKNVGTNKSVSYSDSLSGSDSGNYSLVSAGGSSTASITAAPLIITANNANKTYDGVAYSGGSGVSYSGLVGGETASVLSGSLSYSGSSQGASAVGSYVITPGGLSSGNYTIAFADGVLTIRPVSNLNDQLVPLLQALHNPGNNPTQAELLGLQALDNKQGEIHSLLGSASNDLIVIINGGVRR